MTLPKPYGPRGVAMLFLAGLAYGRAIVYLQPSSPYFTPAILLEWPIPTWAWGFLWLGAGVHVTIAAFRKKHAGALAAIQSMSILWAAVFLVAAWNRLILDGLVAASGSFITASVYVCFAGLIYCMARMVNLSRRAYEMRS